MIQICRNVEEKRPERRRALLRNAYPIPEDLLSFLNNSDVTFESLLGKYPKLKQPVDQDNYDELFHMLLFLEEHQGALDVRQFDMISVCRFLYTVTYYINEFIRHL